MSTSCAWLGLRLRAGPAFSGGAVVARTAWEGGEAGEAGWRWPAAGPMGWGRASACRPGPELVGVSYCPDVRDPVGCGVEREHRHGDAVLLGPPARLAVDRALP